MANKHPKAVAQGLRAHQSQSGGGRTSGMAVSVHEGASVTAAAIRCAHGTESSELARSGGLLRDSPIVRDTVGLALSVDALAAEVRGVLLQMRHLAREGSRSDLARAERAVIQDEFAMLQAQIDEVARSAGDLDYTPGASIRSGMSVDHPAHAFSDRLMARTLGIHEEVASVATSDDAEWALVRIDAAEQTVIELRDELGTVEERVDAALVRLTEFVESVSPHSGRRGCVSDIYAAAERVRMQLMQEAGISVLGQANDLPKGVSSLLQ